MLFRRALTLCLPLLAVPAWGRAQQPSFGPLMWEEGAPLHRLSYTPMSEDADAVGRGGVRMDLWLGYSNVFEQDSSETHVLLMDMERLITTGTVRWGVAAGLEVGGRVTLETTGGGILDSFVLRYHELLGFGQANRDRFPENGYRQRLTDGGETAYVDVSRRTFGLEEVRLFAKWRVLRSADRRSVMSLRAEVRMPRQSNRAGGQRSDGALTALGRLAVGSWYLHGMLDVSTVRAPPRLEEVLREGSLSLMIGVERSLGSSLAGVVQYHVSTPTLRGFRDRELDWAPSNVVFGLAGRLGSRWRWDVSFQEDIPADTPAVDFTLGVRVSRSWR